MTARGFVEGRRPGTPPRQNHPDQGRRRAPHDAERAGLPRDGCRRRRWLGHQMKFLGARPSLIVSRIADIGAILWSDYYGCGTPEGAALNRIAKARRDDPAIFHRPRTGEFGALA